MELLETVQEPNMRLPYLFSIDLENMLDATITSYYDAETWWTLKDDGHWHLIVRNISDLPKGLI